MAHDKRNFHVRSTSVSLVRSGQPNKQHAVFMFVCIRDLTISVNRELKNLHAACM